MLSIVKEDLYRYTGEISYKAFKQALKIPGFKFTFALRKIQHSKKLSFSGIYYRLLFQRYMYRYGFQMPNFTKIGKGFYIGHFGNIVINGKAVIGNWCNISQGVTIGETFRGPKKGTPRIGNEVWIGTNSVIVGNIKIGSNVMIAPLTFVNIDIPDNSLVIGNPCQIIPKSNATEGYINNIYNKKV